MRFIFHTIFRTSFFAELGIKFEVCFGPFRQGFRYHQEELSGIPFGHLRALEHRAEEAAVIGQEDGLDDVEIAFGLNVVVIPDTPDPQCLVIFVDDANHTPLKALHGIFGLEAKQTATQGPCQIERVVPRIPLG